MLLVARETQVSKQSTKPRSLTEKVGKCLQAGALDL